MNSFIQGASIENKQKFPDSFVQTAHVPLALHVYLSVNTMKSNALLTNARNTAILC